MYRANRGYPGTGPPVHGNEQLEEQNEMLEGELKGKVSALKVKELFLKFSFL